MAASIDSSLLGDEMQLTELSYRILDEMTTRGNRVAGFLKAEIQQLETILTQALPLHGRSDSMADSCLSTRINAASHGSSEGLLPPFMDCAISDANWQYTMTTEQMIQVADSIDFEGIDWASL